MYEGSPFAVEAAVAATATLATVTAATRSDAIEARTNPIFASPARARHDGILNCGHALHHDEPVCRLDGAP